MTLCLVISDKKMFFMFSLYKPIKNVTPGAGHFWPEGHNLNKLDRGLLGDATYQYQGSMPCCFRRENYFLMFSL